MFYRKYRSQTFAQLDNKKIRETLGEALLANNFGHAYLFIGPRGTGKTSAARLLAKVVNCTNRKKGEEPCNKCDSCRAITEGMSLDVIEIDAASNTGVDDIRDLREKVKLAPTASKYKVYIIDEVHMLSTSAFNALLKTLEEPPAHVIFVLATTDPQKLPETIVSRCLVYDFGRVTQLEIEDSLARVVSGEKMSVPKEVLTAVAAKARGSFRDAHKILEQLTMQGAKMDLARLDALKSNRIDELARQVLELIVLHKQREALAAVEDFAENSSEKIKDMIDSLLIHLRNNLLSKYGIENESDSLGISVQEIEELVKGLSEVSVLMRDSPVPQLPLEIAIVEFCQRTTKPEQDNSMNQRTAQSEGSAGQLTGESVTSGEPSDDSGFAGVWKRVLEDLKKHNHNLVALLRASRPREIKDGFMTLEVFYKFHKDKLEERKNREILEKLVSDIFGADTKIKFVLSENKKG